MTDRYDPSAETFKDLLNKNKKEAKQAFGDRLGDITETFLFAKLPVQRQNELAMAGKHRATMEEFRTFVQRRCQNAQLLPTTSSAQPFNQISAPQPHIATSQSSNSHPQQNWENKRSLMDNAVTAAYTGTNGPNVENDFEKKVKTIPRTRTRELANCSPAQPNKRTEIQIQPQIGAPNLRKGGTPSPRLLLQEHDCVRIPWHPV